MKVTLLSICFLISVAVPLIAQDLSPVIGDSLYVYSYSSDTPISNTNAYSFFDLDFHCVDKLSVKKSEVPRIDYEIKNQHGIGEVFSEIDGKIVLKGFNMKDPYFGESVKFVQLIGGIPVINKSNIKDHKYEGSQSFYLEYNVNNLPEGIKLWAELNAYTKLRLKVGIEYQTNYIGSETVSVGEELTCYKIRTNYTVAVSLIEVKKEDWLEVQQDEIPQYQQYFQSTRYDYTSYYQKGDNYCLVKVYNHPEIKIEYHLRLPVHDLPTCSDDDNQVYVYPNPTLGDLNIRMVDLPGGKYDFALYNIIGYRVWTTELKLGEQDLFRLRLPDLDKGVYLYSIKNSEDRYIQSKRLTVLKY